MGVVTVDLLKMHPMARKMNVHNEAFAKAIEDGEADNAREHLREIKKFASYLEDDLEYAIHKAEADATQDSYVNNAHILKWNQTGTKFNEENRDRQLPGTIIPSRTNPEMRRKAGTFGRRG